MNKQLLKLLLLCLLVAWGSTSLNAQEAPLLIGKWQLELDKTIAGIIPVKKDKLSKFPSDQQTDIKQSFGSRQFMFLENGRFNVKWSNYEGNHSLSGSWKEEVDSSVIITIDEKSTKFKLIELSSTTLVLSQEGSDGLFNTLHFVRK
jgi:hypothetical protein